MTTDHLVLATAVLSLAGFVQGLTGFGFGMTAMSLLPLILGLDEAQAVVTLTSTAACVLMAAVTLREVPWSSLPRLWLGTVVGVPIGFALFESLPQILITRVLGVMLCSMVVFEFAVTRRTSLRWPRWLEPIVGVASGTLTGAFNIGGPPLVACIYSQPWSKEKHVAALTAVFLSGGLIRVGLLFAHRDLPIAAWTASGWALLPMLIAIVCGNRVLSYLPQRQLRAGVFAVLLLLGGRYLIVGA
ncbi:MAG TPA: sulfite exporter TauE/SafE family protein [Pirellulales bacterium]|nr:sulfite exporter TauE/SafE family protein [Pirellulales bacterium]